MLQKYKKFGEMRNKILRTKSKVLEKYSDWIKLASNCSNLLGSGGIFGLSFQTRPTTVDPSKVDHFLFALLNF